jgi:hypothetical protein
MKRVSPFGKFGLESEQTAVGPPVSENQQLRVKVCTVQTLETAASRLRGNVRRIYQAAFRTVARYGCERRPT